MELNKLLRADYLDILFDGRNKIYGGYELRRKYGQRAKRATLGVVLGFTALASVPVIASSLSPAERVIPSVTIVTQLDKVVLPEHPTPPPIPAGPPPPPATTIRNPELRVVIDKEVTEKPPTIEEVRQAQPALTTSTGTPGPADLVPGSERGTGSLLVDSKGGGEAPIPRVVEQMPQFDGDIEQYLRANLHYPEDARRDGIEGRVGIQFVVNEDGSISQAEVFRKSATVLDAEALRVVRSMPKWKPGKQSGKAVKCYFTLPINFTLD